MNLLGLRNKFFGKSGFFGKKALDMESDGAYNAPRLTVRELSAEGPPEVRTVLALSEKGKGWACFVR